MRFVQHKSVHGSDTPCTGIDSHTVSTDVDINTCTHLLQMAIPQPSTTLDIYAGERGGHNRSKSKLIK